MSSSLCPGSSGVWRFQGSGYAALHNAALICWKLEPRRAFALLPVVCVVVLALFGFVLCKILLEPGLVVLPCKSRLPRWLGQKDHRSV